MEFDWAPASAHLEPVSSLLPHFPPRSREEGGTAQGKGGLQQAASLTKRRVKPKSGKEIQPNSCGLLVFPGSHLVNILG